MPKSWNSYKIHYRYRQTVINHHDLASHAEGKCEISFHSNGELLPDKRSIDG